MVRHRQATGEPIISTALAKHEGEKQPVRAVSPDRALSSTPEGTFFGEWFDKTRVSDDDCDEHRLSVPLSRIYEVADEARRRAMVWTNFARRLEARVNS
jgi:hypothetical protein